MIILKIKTLTKLHGERDYAVSLILERTKEAGISKGSTIMNTINPHSVGQVDSLFFSRRIEKDLNLKSRTALVLWSWTNIPFRVLRSNEGMQ